MRLIGTIFIALSMGFFVLAMGTVEEDIMEWAAIMAGAMAVPGMIFRFLGERRYKRKLHEQIHEYMSAHINASHTEEKEEK